MKNKQIKNIAIYQTPSGAMEVRLDVNKETIFLTQQQIGELFNVQKAAISKHVKNIFETGELKKKSTVSILETVQKEVGMCHLNIKKKKWLYACIKLVLLIIVDYGQRLGRLILQIMSKYRKDLRDFI